MNRVVPILPTDKASYFQTSLALKPLELRGRQRGWNWREAEVGQDFVNYIGTGNGRNNLETASARAVFQIELKNPGDQPCPRDSVGPFPGLEDFIRNR